MKFAKYEFKDGEVLKDGHTMFLEDVIMDLNRKSYLEQFKIFHDHVANHDEVRNAPVNAGKVICKICNKTKDEILAHYMGGKDE